MKMWKVILPVAALLLFAGQVAAQTDDDERAHEMEAREAEIEQKLRAAEARMSEAAREIAEITKERLPRIAQIEQRFAFASKPRLGVTIESSEEAGAVEGVTILGVSPGSAASDAGLRSGDILTAVNDESLGAESCKEANMRLLDFMDAVEEGDMLTVEYLRDGKVGSVEIEPRIVDDRAFAWVSKGGSDFVMPAMPVGPEMVERFKMEFGFPWAGSGLGDLELVELSEGLGRYFGADSGLLVVAAPKSDAFDLRDGDVIQSIDGREPKDVRHAMRILASYQAGEKLELGIMRDKKKVTIDVEIPADHHGKLHNEYDIEVKPAPSS
ncbi:MAG: PDZ domain-containing protein [Gammaproteobacteria bacterium]|jgi:S1-C subfamily serine protease|nr:PDZ domain-containing protein [Gammaproteobacteria bacterium]